MNSAAIFQYFNLAGDFTIDRLCNKADGIQVFGFCPRAQFFPEARTDTLQSARMEPCSILPSHVPRKRRIERNLLT